MKTGVLVLGFLCLLMIAVSAVDVWLWNLSFPKSWW